MMGFFKKRIPLFYLGAYLPGLAVGLAAIFLHLPYSDWQEFNQTIGVLQIFWGIYFGVWLFIFCFWHWREVGFDLVAFFYPKNYFDYLFLALFLYNIISCFWGLFLGNPLRYLLGDTFKGMIFPLVYFSFRNTHLSREELWKFITVLAIGEFLSLILFVYKIPVINFSGRTIIYSSGLILLGEMVHPKHRFGVYALYSMGILVLLTSEAYRGNIIVFIIILIFSLILQIHRKPFVQTMISYFIPILLTLGVYVGIKVLAPRFIDQALVQIRDTVQIKRGHYQLDESLSQRVTELYDVYDQMHGRDWYHWILGLGNGALLQNKRITPAEFTIYQTDVKHNIYITPLAILFRNGVIGVSLLLLLYVWVGREIYGLYKMKSRIPAGDTLIQIKYFLLLHVSILILSWIVYIYPGNLVVAFCILFQRQLKTQILTNVE